MAQIEDLHVRTYTRVVSSAVAESGCDKSSKDFFSPPFITSWYLFLCAAFLLATPPPFGGGKRCLEWKKKKGEWVGGSKKPRQTMWKPRHVDSETKSKRATPNEKKQKNAMVGWFWKTKKTEARVLLKCGRFV